MGKVVHWIDYLIVALLFAGVSYIGWKLGKTGAAKSTREFLVAGRKMPWWLISLSDIATGLNTSTMLQDTRKVRQDGLMGMWFAWAFIIKGCVSAVFFERLWRRAAFKTQLEFYRSRYDGWQANFARIYDTLIYGGFVSCLWAGVGLVGMKKVAIVLMGLPPTLPFLGLAVPCDVPVVLCCTMVAMFYATVAGAKGVYWTDLLELVVAVAAIYVLLFYVMREVGWNTGLREKLENLGPGKEKYLQFMQPLSFVYLWFFVTNPFLDHGGFSPAMQRTLSLKDEREVIYTQIARGIFGNVLRGSPFLIIGIASIFIISDDFLLSQYPPIYTPEGAPIPDFENVFPALVVKYLPVGFLGLMVAAFFSAFMSSFSPNIHLSSSLLINDLYKPYLVKKKEDTHYVRATQWTMIGAACFTVIVGMTAKDIFFLTNFAVTISLGVGWIKLLRIIWWRANGTGDVAAQIFSFLSASFILSPWGKQMLLRFMEAGGWSGNDQFFILRNLLLIGSSTLVAVVAVLLTKPEPMEKLCSFYRRMRPFGFWGPVRRLCPEVAPPESIGVQLALVFSSLAVLWGVNFGVLALWLAYWQLAGWCFLGMFIGGVGVRYFTHCLYPTGWQAVERPEED